MRMKLKAADDENLQALPSTVELPGMAELGDGVLPPNSEDAERTVVAACLINPDIFPEVRKVVSHDHFYHGLYRGYFKAIVDLTDKGEIVDSIMLAKQLRTTEGNRVSDINELINLNPAISIRNVLSHAKLVSACFAKRKAMEIGRRCTALAASSEEDVLLTIERIKDDLTALAKAQPNDGAVGRSAKDCFASMRKGLENPLPSIPTGLANYDELIQGGFREAQLVVVAGLPGMGKTAAALGTALNVAKAGHGVMFFSLEMTSEELMQRAASSEGHIPLGKITRNEMADPERRSLDIADRIVSGLPLVLDDEDGLTTREIADRAERQALRFRAEGKELRLIVVDYLQIAHVHEKDLPKDYNEAKRIEVVARSLKNLAKRLKVTILALAQFNREASKADAIPSMSWLHGGSEIEKAADILTFLLPAEKAPAAGYDPNAAVKVKWWIQKQRSGPSFTAAYMWFFKQFTLFQKAD